MECYCTTAASTTTATIPIPLSQRARVTLAMRLIDLTFTRDLANTRSTPYRNLRNALVTTVLSYIFTFILTIYIYIYSAYLSNCLVYIITMWTLFYGLTDMLILCLVSSSVKKLWKLRY